MQKWIEMERWRIWIDCKIWLLKKAGFLVRSNSRLTCICKNAVCSFDVVGEAFRLFFFDLLEDLVVFGAQIVVVVFLELRPLVLLRLFLLLVG